MALGLVMLGAGPEGDVLRQMVDYGRETQHEKIIRGLCVGIALIVFGRREEAEVVIDDLIHDKVCFLPVSAVFMTLDRLSLD